MRLGAGEVPTRGEPACRSASSIPAAFRHRPTVSVAHTRGSEPGLRPGLPPPDSKTSVVEDLDLDDTARTGECRQVVGERCGQRDLGEITGTGTHSHDQNTSPITGNLERPLATQYVPRYVQVALRSCRLMSSNRRLDGSIR